MAKRRGARRSRTATVPKAAAEFLRWERVCRVATVGADATPHVVPVCHVFANGRLYFGSGTDARKVLNLRANARLAVTVDAYTDDWTALRGVLLQGTARLIPRGREFQQVRARLYEKYPQYPGQSALSPSDSIIVELTPTHAFTWGFEGK